MERGLFSRFFFAARRPRLKACAGNEAWSMSVGCAGSEEGWERDQDGRAGRGLGGGGQQKKRPQPLQLLLVKLSHTCIQRDCIILLK